MMERAASSMTAVVTAQPGSSGAMAAIAAGYTHARGRHVARRRLARKAARREARSGWSGARAGSSVAACASAAVEAASGRTRSASGGARRKKRIAMQSEEQMDMSAGSGKE
jgi:hypothetical protein